MGFFQQYDATADGLSFIAKEEKEELIQASTSLKVLRIFEAVTQFGPRYVVVVELDGEERAVGFGKGVVESRDRMLDAMIEYFDQEGEVDAPNIFLARVGRSVLIRDAGTPEQAA